jgi:2-polyprenyl-3-methyl-5-hydroxy-6-metoxy-1,4-benzoquinol methylase
MAQRRGDPLAGSDPAIDRWLRDPFVCAALTRLPVTDLAVEQVLTYLRRCTLLQTGTAIGSAPPAARRQEFACAVAAQCFTSGYAFFAEDDELARVREIRQAVEAALREREIDFRALEPALIAIAMYDYLDALSGFDRLSTVRDSEWSQVFRTIVRQQIHDRRREHELATTIERVTAIDDPVSLAVRHQYEAHPYPVWTGLHRVDADSVEALATRLRPDRLVASRTSPARILVAGCGTGEQAVQTARTYPQSEVVGVDLSLASLAYAARMTEKHGITNVVYRQADILELARLDQRFAVVECTGVLHHLRDPLAGWRVLVGLLEPDGVMRVALYSERARRTLDAATGYLRSLHLPPTADGTRRGRQAIIALPDGHPTKAAMAFGDFYSLNGCRDLLMHAQEHRFTLPRIAECLSMLGLRFLGMQCSGKTQRRFLDMFGDRQAAGDLLAWDRFEDAYPATFAGMYSFWCCRDSADSG